MKRILISGTFDGSLTLTGHILGMAGVLFGEAQEGVNGLLVWKRGQYDYIDSELRTMDLQSEWPWISTIIFFRR